MRLKLTGPCLEAHSPASVSRGTVNDVRSIPELGLVPGLLDDTVVFWDRGGPGRVVCANDYSLSVRYLDRLLGRFGYERSQGNHRSRLRDAGETMPVPVPGRQVIGLMRPYLFGRPMAIRRAASPYVICQVVDGRYGVPIMTESREQSEALIAEISTDRGLDRAMWRAYEAERARDVYKKLADDLVTYGYLTRYRTDLEAAVAHTLEEECPGLAAHYGFVE